MNQRSSAIEIFNQIFHPAPAVATCAHTLCDRRPAKGSRFCGCCKQDRIEGRTVIAGAGEILPFVPELERKYSAGPCPTMGVGDAAIRESAAFTARENRRRDGHSGTPWGSQRPPARQNAGGRAGSNGNPPQADPRKKKRSLRFGPQGQRTGISFSHVN